MILSFTGRIQQPQRCLRVRLGCCQAYPPLHSSCRSPGLAFPRTRPQLRPWRAEVDSQSNVTRHDYLPFGQEIPNSWGVRVYYNDYARADGFTRKFTGKERDAETGLDYFGARYLSGAQGRFISPDEFPSGIVNPFTGQQVGRPGPLPYADITDPQTLNKYGYARNNPLRYVDPDGHEPDDPVVVQEIVEFAIVHIDKVEAVAEAVDTGVSVGLGMAARTALLFLTVCQGTAGDKFEQKWERENQKRQQELQQLQQQQPGQQPDQPGQIGQQPRTSPTPQNASEHTKNPRPSTKEEHEKGEKRKKRDAGGEKGDEARKKKGMWPRRPPGGKQPKGGWPPKDRDQE